MGKKRNTTHKLLVKGKYEATACYPNNKGVRGTWRNTYWHWKKVTCNACLRTQKDSRKDG